MERGETSPEDCSFAVSLALKAVDLASQIWDRNDLQMILMFQYNIALDPNDSEAVEDLVCNVLGKDKYKTITYKYTYTQMFKHMNVCGRFCM